MSKVQCHEAAAATVHTIGTSRLDRPHLSPAKAGYESLMVLIPGFRSLRSFHPGLNSAVGSADSLNDSIWDVAVFKNSTAWLELPFADSIGSVAQIANGQ